MYRLTNSFAFLLCTAWMVLTACGCSISGNSTSGTDSSNDEKSSEDEQSSDSKPTDSDSAPPVDRDSQFIEKMAKEDAETLNTLAAAIEASANMSVADLHAQYPAKAAASLDFAPGDALNLQRIQESNLALDTGEMAHLDTNGFVISNRLVYPSFHRGYTSIYGADLPVYISADAIMDTVHRSFDAILKNVEEYILIDKLNSLVSNMRKALGDDGALDADIKADLDMYLAVAHSLLTDELQSSAVADNEQIRSFLEMAKEASGMETVSFLGTERMLDFSQFTPRGHYTETVRLRNYFRAMMWLGRIDFRMVETQKDGTQVVNRPQLKAVVALDTVIQEHLALWDEINRTIELFVGVSDNMTPARISSLRDALGITSADDVDALSDDEIKGTILKSGFGAQRICSHLMKNGIEGTTLPLNASFMILGQRFTPDSEVFSNVVYDRVQRGNVYRMMPSPLDVGFAVFNNNQAAVLLEKELTTYGYATDLHMMRTIVNTFDDRFWNASLYNMWTSALRTLSPADTTDMPKVMQTAQWEKRMLNTQLGSWAQLRHDTLLYAKQSYTDIPECEYPDAYVDPYPAFFKTLQAYADKGIDVATALSDDNESALMSQVLNYFTRLWHVSDILSEMAQQELDGAPFTAEQLGFVNDAIRIGYQDAGCAEIPYAAGWYADLFFDMDSALDMDPTIADVHTQPADESGAMVGKILHVATGLPRVMVVTINQCDGPHAYAGMVFAYHEKVTENFERLTDEQWATELYPTLNPSAADDSYTPPADVPWITDLLAW
ncbi:MAG: DUF3160 domain-containing protein [Deltaproteobacteria bacterium]|nr:DUF3160 domain-containing protein [Deltaproteobacteria bacterium]